MAFIEKLMERFTDLLCVLRVFVGNYAKQKKI
jgi:hypothetical protein